MANAKADGRTHQGLPVLARKGARVPARHRHARSRRPRHSWSKGIHLPEQAEGRGRPSAEPSATFAHGALTTPAPRPAGFRPLSTKGTTPVHSNAKRPKRKPPPRPLSKPPSRPPRPKPSAGSATRCAPCATPTSTTCAPGGRGKTATDTKSVFKVHVVEAWPELAARPARRITAHQIAAVIRKVREAGRAHRRHPSQLPGRRLQRRPPRPVRFGRRPSDLILFEIEANPAEIVPTIPRNRGDRNLSADELKTYMEALGDDAADKTLYVALLAGGQRLAQLVRAKARATSTWIPERFACGHQVQAHDAARTPATAGGDGCRNRQGDGREAGQARWPLLARVPTRCRPAGF